MQLTSFRVQLFRNIVDSDDIKVDKNTCLVGKNEAGKSSLLEALHRLNPAKPATFNELDDYPRWLLKQHQLQGKIGDAIPIMATFQATPEESAKLEDRFGKGVVRDWKLIAQRKYKGNIETIIDVDFNKFYNAFSSQHLGTIKEKVEQIEDTAGLISSLDSIASEHVEATSEPSADARSAKQAKDTLIKILGGNANLEDAVRNSMTELLPKTFYFAHYANLAGRYNLDEILPIMGQARTGDPDKAARETAADFLKLAHIDPANVQVWDFERWNAELEAVSGMLTDLVQNSWKQNKFLRLRVTLEPQPIGNNTQRFLQFRVEDTRQNFTSRLDRRSTGFQWFVSFIASFFEFQANKNVILLLDEPGLSLHARAQMDLLESIDSKIANDRQVVYTTHSPFMILPNNLAAVRIVEDNGPPKGGTVTNDAGVISDPDTLFPLQAALGYDIAQNLFIGKRTILVEGVSDYIYLSVISTYLRSKNRASIPLDSRLLPCGGATNIPTFIALLGGKLELVVLLDGNAQRQKINVAILEGRLKETNVISVA